METKHTKGEWEIEGSTIFPKGNGYSIAIVSHISIANTSQPPYEEAQANAKLIAAAPELLEACIKALKEIQNPKRDGSLAEDVLINAIKKAT